MTNKNLDHWLYGWVLVLCGLIRIISFGYFRPSLDFDYVIWRTKTNIKADKK